MTASRPTVVVAGLGDTGVLVATRLARTCRVVGITTRPALVSGQELGTRVTDPHRWRRTYLVPFRRFRRLDAVDVVHGRIVRADLDAELVEVETAAGDRRRIPYDFLVVATGIANGFWRHDRVEDLATVDAAVDDVHRQLAQAALVAVVGGGATGVSVADNLARTGGPEVHLFFSGDEPLPDFHPDARRWVVRRLADDGVVLHPNHRAVVPDGFHGEQLTTDPVEWSTGQPPFTADAVLWAVGATRPYSDFLPAAVLDDEGFVRVDANLRVPRLRQRVRGRRRRGQRSVAQLGAELGVPRDRRQRPGTGAWSGPEAARVQGGALPMGIDPRDPARGPLRGAAQRQGRAVPPVRRRAPAARHVRAPDPLRRAPPISRRPLTDDVRRHHLAPSAGFEPATHGLGNRRSIP